MTKEIDMKRSSNSAAALTWRPATFLAATYVRSRTAPSPIFVAQEMLYQQCHSDPKHDVRDEGKQEELRPSVVDSKQADHWSHRLSRVVLQGTARVPSSHLLDASSTKGDTWDRGKEIPSMPMIGI